MSGLLRLLLRSKQDPLWPRFREGARKDERAWISQLTDRDLVDVVRGLAQVDKAVKDAHKAKKDAA